MNHIEMEKNKMSYGKVVVENCMFCEIKHQLNKNLQKQLELYHDRINEIALSNCSEYPNIDGCNAYEQLLAIEITLKKQKRMIDNNSVDF